MAVKDQQQNNEKDNIVSKYGDARVHSNVSKQ